MHAVIAQRQIGRQHERRFTDEPAVQVVRRGEVVGLPHTGADGAVLQTDQTCAGSPWVTCTQKDVSLSARPMIVGGSGRDQWRVSCAESASARPSSVCASTPSAASTAIKVSSSTGTERPVQSWYSVATPNRWASSASDAAVMAAILLGCP